MIQIKKLEVGDTLYKNHNGTWRRIKIDRVTEKTAFAGTIQFKREYSDGSLLREKGATVWDGSWELSTPELQEQFELAKLRQRARAAATQLNSVILTKEQCESFLEWYKTLTPHDL